MRRLSGIMVGMVNQVAIPVASDWCTMAYAAEKIGVSLREVGRLVKDGRLTAQRPRVGSKESARTKTILQLDQVRAYAVAYKMTKKPVEADDGKD